MNSEFQDGDQRYEQATVQVDEEGSRVGPGMDSDGNFGSQADAENLPVFRADHPFLFLIRDNRTGSIVFMGRVVNPQQVQGPG